jgi:hypothetical protein
MSLKFDFKILLFCFFCPSPRVIGSLSLCTLGRRAPPPLPPFSSHGRRPDPPPTPRSAVSCPAPPSPLCHIQPGPSLSPSFPRAAMALKRRRRPLPLSSIPWPYLTPKITVLQYLNRFIMYGVLHTKPKSIQSYRIDIRL